MAKFKKGAVCFRFVVWSDLVGSFSVSRVLIESWGAKQATFRRLDAAGQPMAQERVYVDLEADQFVAEADCADPIAAGRERSAAYIAASIERNRAKLTNPAYNLHAVEERIDVLRSATPRCGWLEDLRAMIAATYAL